MAIGSFAVPSDGALRVLVVDDSPPVQRLVTAVLDAEPNVKVVGVAGDGHRALDVFAQCQPDVVVLDLEMPGMDGPSTFAAMTARGQTAAVVVFSGVAPPEDGQLGAAIARGQVTAISKPSGVANLDDAFNQMRTTLIPAIIQSLESGGMGRVTANGNPAIDVSTSGRPTADSFVSLGQVRAVSIGASTGGPDALDRFFSELTAPLPVPTFVVQHIDAKFTDDLAKRLSKHQSTVVTACDGDVPQPGWVYLAPGEHHLVLDRRAGEVVIRITDTEPVNSCRPSVDVLFESAADTYGKNQLAIVMTGMGQDGLAGCRTLADRGATILVQDSATSVIWGMPGVVAKADLADRELPVDDMAQLVNRWALTARPSPVASRKPAVDA